jgi:hypothetical protein
MNDIKTITDVRSYCIYLKMQARKYFDTNNGTSDEITLDALNTSVITRDTLERILDFIDSSIADINPALLEELGKIPQDELDVDYAFASMG